MTINLTKKQAKILSALIANVGHSQEKTNSISQDFQKEIHLIHEKLENVWGDDFICNSDYKKHKSILKDGGFEIRIL